MRLWANDKLTGKEQLFRFPTSAEFQVEMTKVKKEKVDGEEAADVTEKSYQELIANVNPIAQPLASKKLSKKLYKCVKKGESRTDFIQLFAQKSFLILKLFVFDWKVYLWHQIHDLWM